MSRSTLPPHYTVRIKVKSQKEKKKNPKQTKQRHRESELGGRDSYIHIQNIFNFKLKIFDPVCCFVLHQHKTEFWGNVIDNVLGLMGTKSTLDIAARIIYKLISKLKNLMMPPKTSSFCRPQRIRGPLTYFNR